VILTENFFSVHTSYINE